MDALSPTRTCDPWAVLIAKRLGNSSGGFALTLRQSQILDFLRDRGGTEPHILTDRLGISYIELEREIATLRHMEEAKAELRADKRVITLW